MSVFSQMQHSDISVYLFSGLPIWILAVYPPGYLKPFGAGNTGRFYSINIIEISPKNRYNHFVMNHSGNEDSSVSTEGLAKPFL